VLLALKIELLRGVACNGGAEMTQVGRTRRLPVGAEPLVTGGVHFRVWAPVARTLAVEIEGLPKLPLVSEPNGYFSGTIPSAQPGMRYRFRRGRDDRPMPDPASRFQPDGPHGASEIVDPNAYTWTDAKWRGRPREQLVVYEMHVGTFTRQGTWNAAADQLPELAALGITCIEIMPVAEFAGEFGWGYDGVALFAPTRLYGRPDEFRRFIDEAHRAGIAVILDVVYNHLGPIGNYLKFYADAYFTDRYKNDWGEAINFDGPDAGPSREFFLANASYWIDEFHLDGLRLDATQQIFDKSDDNILAAIVRTVRQAAGDRITFVVGENEPQHAKLARPPEHGGYGLDALWNDDFHHSAMVALTGRHEAYYSDYRGRPSEFIAAAKYGFLYQGQRYRWQKQPRGTPSLDLPAESFVVFLQNHDQIANSGTGQRAHVLTSPGRWRAITAHFLLMPGIPMLFQGQEFSSTSPFFYFAGYRGEKSRAVRDGRGKSLAQFPSLATAEMQAELADPGARDTYERSVLDFGERETNAGAYALHRDLLTLRREDSVFGCRPCRIDGAVLTEDAWVLRYFADNGLDRLLIVNLGLDLALDPAPEPLLAPVEGTTWKLLWSSESPRYGGGGTPVKTVRGIWRIPAEAALIFCPGATRLARAQRSPR
jgi:maltooligosyltrehalose trehalohydrolase